MAGCKHKNISNINQGYLASSEPNSPTIASPGYTNTLERQDSDLKLLHMMMIEDIKKDINNSLKEIQENIGKQLEALKEETQKSLIELQENTIKQVKERNKTIQDLKMELETIKKSQRETTLKLENLGKRSGVIDASITNRIQEIGERMSGAEDTIENIDTHGRSCRDKIWSCDERMDHLVIAISRDPSHNQLPNADTIAYPSKILLKGP
jgi:chromosome segregation ATPase